MNKHLLILFIASFFYLACAQEEQVDNDLIDTLINEEQLIIEGKDSFGFNNTTKEEIGSNDINLKSNTLTLNDTLSYKKVSVKKNSAIANSQENSNGKNSNIKNRNIKKNPIQELNTVGYSEASNLINNKDRALDVQLKSGESKGIANGFAKSNSVENKQVKLTNSTNQGNNVQINSKNQQPIKFKIDTIRLNEIWLLKNLKTPLGQGLSNNSKNIISDKPEGQFSSSKTLLSTNIDKNTLYKEANTKDQVIKKKLKQIEVNKEPSKVANSFEDKEDETFANQIGDENRIKANINGKYVNTSNANKDSMRYSTSEFEPVITPLFTDAGSHSKKYEKPLQKELTAKAATQINKGQAKTKTKANIAVGKTQVNRIETKESSSNSSVNAGFNSVEKTANDKVKNNDQYQQPATFANTKIKTLKELKAYKNSPRNNDVSIKLLSRGPIYQTDKNYTLLFEIKNKGKAIDAVNMVIELPQYWKIISISDLGQLNENEKKLGFISFYIPTQSPSGTVTSSVKLKMDNSILNSLDFELQIANNYELEVFNVFAPQQVQAGELITSTFGIKNNGNVDQEVILSSTNTIKGDSKIIVPQDSTIIVELSQKTSARSDALRTISKRLEVYSKASQKKYYKRQSVEVIPVKIRQKDPYFRYPVQASLYYSSHTDYNSSNRNDHYSTISAELRGDGYLDLEKDHHLNFIIRAPKKTELRRFSIVDQYSLIYNYKNKTILHLGDHSYYHNRLGFGTRYGMGFKVEQNIKKWSLSTFYSRPRLFSYSKKPSYGVRAVYHESDSLKLGMTLERSEGNTYFLRNRFNQDGKGQILTFDYNYLNKNTRVEAEASASANNKVFDFATYLSFTQYFKNVSFTSNLILAGKNYIGNISNSLQVSNNLNYNYKGLNVGLGQRVSKVNRRLDPLYFETEPYYETYFATLGYRINKKHFFRLRFDKRTREDQLEPSSYHYNEYGLSYNFHYYGKLFSGNFGGRFAKTQNMLSAFQNYRDSYSHQLNVSYKILNNFKLRGGLNYMYTNRYGITDSNINYLRYNIGFNYNLQRKFTLSMNYNSGYSPEENYRRREFINLNLRANINRNHRFEIRANYFENPAVIDNKELFAYAKYTYSFGVGVKRLFDQGGIEGSVFSNSSDINIKGIKLYTAGKTITTDKFGNFELNNLELGTNYIYLDDASLPLNVVSTQKNPIQVNVEKDRKVVVDLQLVKSGNLIGKLALENKELAIETNLEGYVKLENDNFSYYAEARKDGSFKFQNVVPGGYKFTIIRFKENEEFFSFIKETEVTVNEDMVTDLQIAIKGRERKIKFKDINLKVGYND